MRDYYPTFAAPDPYTAGDYYDRFRRDTCSTGRAIGASDDGRSSAGLTRWRWVNIEGAALSESQLRQMKELYGYDKPDAHFAYLAWLGVLPRDLNRRDIEFQDNDQEVVVRMRVPPFHIAELDWDSDGFVKAEEIPASIATYIPFTKLDTNKDGRIDGWEAENPEADIGGPEPVKVASLTMECQPSLTKRNNSALESPGKVDASEDEPDILQCRTHRTRCFRGATR